MKKKLSLPMLLLLLLLSLITRISTCQSWDTSSNARHSRRRLFASFRRPSHTNDNDDSSASSGSSSSSSSFPEPAHLEEACRANNTTRICDITNVFGAAYRHYLQTLIDQLENSYYVMCNGQTVGMQLGVYIERDNSINDYANNNNNNNRRRTRGGSYSSGRHDGQRIAAEIHQKWGVGYPTDCGNSGLLLYLALDDSDDDEEGGDGGGGGRSDRYQRHGNLYISRGDALNQVVPDQVLQNLESGALPYLQQLKYGAAIQYAVTYLTAYMNGDQTQETVSHEQNLVMALGVLVLLLYFLKCYILRRALLGQSLVNRCANVLARNSRKDIEKKLQEVCHTTECTFQSAVEGRALYMPGRCPICLGPFPDDFPNKMDGSSTKCTEKSKDSTESTPLLESEKKDSPPTRTDGNIKPLLILPCGHVYDYSCILDWFVHQRSKQAKPTCPICLHELKFYP